MSQYKLQDLFLRCTVTNRINNRLINTATKAKEEEERVNNYISVIPHRASD